MPDEFTEIESGKRNDRPELDKALAACKKHKAKLIIAKLDRLSRNVAFIATLLERKVDFLCCDNPHATKFNLHILSAVAEFERDAISRRTKEALAAAKARGTTRDGRPLKLGDYPRIAEAKQRATAARAEAMRPAITETAHLSARAAADELNRRSVMTASGKPWHAMQIIRMRDRLGLLSHGHPPTPGIVPAGVSAPNPRPRAAPPAPPGGIEPVVVSPWPTA